MTPLTGPSLPLHQPKAPLNIVGGIRGGLGTGLFASVTTSPAQTAVPHRGVNQRQDEFWVDDHSATEYMRQDPAHFVDVPAPVGPRVKGAGGIILSMVGCGNLCLLVNQGIGNFKSPMRDLALECIAHVPNLGQYNLLSTKR